LVAKKRHSRKDDDSNFFDEKWFKNLDKPKRGVGNIVFLVIIVVLAVSTIGINAFLIIEYTNSIQEYDSSRELYDQYNEELEQLTNASCSYYYDKNTEFPYNTPVSLTVFVTNTGELPFMLTLQATPDYRLGYSNDSTNRPIYAYENVIVPGETRAIELTVTRKTMNAFELYPIMWVQSPESADNTGVQGTPT